MPSAVRDQLVILQDKFLYQQFGPESPNPTYLHPGQFLSARLGPDRFWPQSHIPGHFLHRPEGLGSHQRHGDSGSIFRILMIRV